MQNGDAPPVRLVIIATHDGAINVDGPIDDEVLCLGLLEMAKIAIRRYKANKEILQPPRRLQ